MTVWAIPHSLPIAAIMAYLLGSVPFGLFLTRFFGAGDLRKIGSGNIGATNVLRTGRKGLAAATLLLDGLKGVLAVLLARKLCPEGVAMAVAVAGLLAVIGHCFPVWLRFRGGKGVASGLGVILAMCWPAGLACCVIWLAVARLTRISSAGALAAFIAAPVLMPLLSRNPVFSPVPIAMALITLLIILRHRDNIARIIAGRESQIQINHPPHPSSNPRS